MATRDVPFAPGTPCWVDLLTSDVPASKVFYGGLFGWEAQDSGEEFGNYVTFTSDGYNVAGMMARPEGNPMPDAWTTYISTNDVEASVAAIGEAGGSVAMPVAQVGDLGSMAIVMDTAGAAFGLWQPGQHTGFGKYNEPGSVTWDEYHAKDFPSAVPFYEEVFGWEMDRSADTDEFRYYQAQVDGETVAGLFDAANVTPAQVPSHWDVYFSVEDVDDAVAKVKALGGQELVPAMDTPFGRMATVTDSTGSAFMLHSMNLKDS